MSRHDPPSASTAAAVRAALVERDLYPDWHPETGGSVGAFTLGPLTIGPFDGDTGAALLPVLFIGDDSDDGDEYPADEPQRLAAAAARMLRP